MSKRPAAPLNKGGQKKYGANNDGFENDNSLSTVPIFLKKLAKMIETCDPSICSWSDDGEMFVVKNPDSFADLVIPQYFDHNKFSSFARQLNFYGFRKIQTKPLRNDDFDKSTAKWVTFHNENFKRGRPDLLAKIQRSTRGGADKATLADQAREVDSLNAKVFILEEKVRDLEATLERNILGKVEAMVMNMVGSSGYPGFRMPAAQNMFPHERSFGSIGFRADPLLGAQAVRAFSTASGSSMGGAEDGQPTLPPHPKQKILPPPPTGTIPTHSVNGALRNMSGGHLTNSSLLLRNAWEDKFLSSVMMTDGASRAASLAGFVPGLSGGLGGGNVGGLAALAAAQQMQNQQQQIEYAALWQKNAQQGAVAGIGGGASDGDDSSKNQKDFDLQRQTTAEILLEAAGELGTNANLPAPDKAGGLRRESTGTRFLAAAQVDAKESKRAKV
mmetsp:Transcript_21374/g.34972  ORF Transcript_21374/g.34972 Transcript_21374/m.34972 type:complete len:445 (-) Transcript_21374:167-1501(-)